MGLKYPRVAGFQLIEQIGGGGFSTVFRAVNIDEHRVVACKVVSLTPETTEYQRKTLDKEIRVHSALKHRNILEFINAVVVEPSKSSHYYPGYYLLLEIAAGGDLFDKIEPDVGVGDEVAHHYFMQLIAGLNYIHQEGVCHRDLKPENMLLDAAGTLKITDFGLCSVYKLKETGQTRKLSERCGSLPYVAPELETDEPYDAEPIDIWGCGVILFTMLVGNTPWDEPTRRSNEFTRYLTGQCFDDEPWNLLGRDVLSLITGMLDIDPSRRMTMKEIFQHKWLSRPSQFARQGPGAIAERLTENLKAAGALDIATPDMESMDTDEDGDQVMGTANTYKSQFTQSLLLFSQTQFGQRYTPHLTRFYASLGPGILATLIQEALTSFGVKFKPPTQIKDGDRAGMLRMRIGGYDKRKLMFKGVIELESFEYGDFSGTFCLMHRDQGNPISWRQLWRSIIEYPAVNPHVLRKKSK
ncbi:protein kinase superfamily protein [Abortiporus biennis]